MFPDKNEILTGHFGMGHVRKSHEKIADLRIKRGSIRTALSVVNEPGKTVEKTPKLLKSRTLNAHNLSNKGATSKNETDLKSCEYELFKSVLRLPVSCFIDERSSIENRILGETRQVCVLIT